MTQQPARTGRWDLIRSPDGRVAVRLPGGDLVLHTILGVGRNYADHAAEMGAESPPERPMIFSKNAASACLNGDDIIMPRACADREQVDYEGELAVIIGQAAVNVPHERAGEIVLGYCVANDVSARWWQKQGSGGQFFRGKSFDTFCPLGPFVTPATRIADPQAFTIETRLNGRVVQHAPTSSMIFPVFELIAELSRGMTLLAGTVILTGTPAGVGAGMSPPRFLSDGDEVTVSIEGLGSITNRVRNS
ncbi:MAG: fumarylacetoacetate hydrolase family protein [Phycisphaerales bacterium]